MINRITVGFVVQQFTDDGTFLRQHFVAGDQVDIENELGEPVEAILPDVSFDMVDRSAEVLCEFFESKL